MSAYQTYAGAHPSIRINVLNELPRDRYLAVLKRIRAAIANGRKLKAYDDTTPGNKSTSCSWGLCHESKETWPDAQDHTFPEDFKREGRISPLDNGHEHPCPMDRRGPHQGDYNGCFYTCRIFKSRKQPKPSREEALRLYDEAIAALETPTPIDE